ncbi:MAG: hypothetical protein IJ523_05735 [Succinivibrionaceae bacterium]|nr:hypothetical protein [Succinivibrionaceae bacterium]
MAIFSHDFFEQLKELVHNELNKKLKENPQYFAEIFNKSYEKIKDPNGLLDYGRLKDNQLKRDIFPESFALSEMDCKFSVCLKFESVFEIQNIDNGEYWQLFKDTPVEIPVTVTLDATNKFRLIMDDKEINAENVIIG